MARPFGGRFSPGTPLRDHATREALAETRRVDAAGARANLLFLPPLLAAVTGLFSGPAALLLSLLAAAALAMGATCLRDGLRAEAAHRAHPGAHPGARPGTRPTARPLARPPALPRKSLAALLAGAGTLLAALSGGTDLVGAALYGVAAAALHLAAFGVDPLPLPLPRARDDAQADRVARVTAEAEAHLARMRAAVARLGDRALDARAAAFEALARRMARDLEANPGALPGARKWLTVYLMGARDASEKLADLDARTLDPQLRAEARADYEALLLDLQTSFGRRSQAMLDGGRQDMEVEIRVLRDRLRRDAVE